jgi:hypothetical protein
MTAHAQALGVSPRAHCVLAHARGGELTQSQVAEQCALDKTTMVVTMELSSSVRAGRAAGPRAPIGRRADHRRHAGRRADRRRRPTRSSPGIYGEVLAALPAGPARRLRGRLAQLAGGRLSTPPSASGPVRRRAVRAP